MFLFINPRAIFLASCACILFAQSNVAQVIQRPPTLSQELSRYIEYDNFDHRYDYLIWGILRDSLKGTSLEGRVSVNSAPQKAGINVYILKRDPDAYFRGIKCNCAYVGELNTIICDSELLSYLSHLLNMDFEQPGELSREEMNYVNYRTSEFLLHWVFGHELGHVLAHHQISPAYFTSAVSDDDRASVRMLSTEEEEAADTFAARSLKTPDKQMWAWFTLGDLIKTLYLDAFKKQAAANGIAAISARELNDLIFAEKLKLMLPATGDPHPPWLVRALNFEAILRSQYPEAVVDTTGYYPKMLNTITVVPNTSSASSLCESNLSGEHEVVFVRLPERVISDSDLRQFRTLDLMKIFAFKAAEREATQWIAALSASQVSDPAERAQPYEMRGDNRMALERYREAATDYRVALRFTPNDPYAHDNLGFCYFMLGNTPRAVSEFRKSTTLKPDLADAWAGLGVAYFSLGQRRAGIEAFRHALRIQPLYAEPDFLRLQAFFGKRALNVALKIVNNIKEVR